MNNENDSRTSIDAIDAMAYSIFIQHRVEQSKILPKNNNLKIDFTDTGMRAIMSFEIPILPEPLPDKK